MKTPHEKRVEEVENKLNAVLNKAVLFKEQVITIIGFKIFTTAVSIVTTEDCFTIELHLVEQYLDNLSGEIPTTFTPTDTKKLLHWDEPEKKQFKEISPEQLKKNDEMENQKITTQPTQDNQTQMSTATETLVVPTNVEIIGYNPTKENVQVKDALMDMLKRVSTNQAAIPQAKAVCDIANTMVNIQKNEIQMIQMANRTKK